jgi:GntR family transcriptional regulator, rspAB operon transcriptional repressor
MSIPKQQASAPRRSPPQSPTQRVLRADTLAGQAYRRIKELILIGAIPPLHPIDEKQLMQELQVGRTPIREAIQRLAYDGLVTIIPFRGTVASGIDMSDLDQIMETRVPMEILAGRLAAQRITEEQLRALRALVASYDVPGLCAERNFVELLRLDQEFHRAIAAIAANKFLEQILENLRDLTWRFYILFYRRHDPHPDEGFNNYDAIVEALAARDPDLLEERLKEHFRGGRAVFPR